MAQKLAKSRKKVQWQTTSSAWCYACFFYFSFIYVLPFFLFRVFVFCIQQVFVQISFWTAHKPTFLKTRLPKVAAFCCSLVISLQRKARGQTGNAEGIPVLCKCPPFRSIHTGIPGLPILVTFDLWICQIADAKENPANNHMCAESSPKWTRLVCFLLRSFQVLKSYPWDIEALRLTLNRVASEVGTASVLWYVGTWRPSYQNCLQLPCLHLL